MAPAFSKPSETAKKFIVCANVKEGHFIGIKISSDDMKSALRKASVLFQATVNNYLKEAVVKRVTNAIIQATLDGKVSAGTAILIVGRGNGPDITDKAFYKGDGSIDGPGCLYF
jgi:hypothetical protein